ncbi:uncharacterized protein LOC115810733 [Chanos chanos]|uniref:Uncharacterized protein LOC115810733 n=1 Tax=Chanos chanos TaxID=29144 RepID=A0A6J2V9L4_CHACN|nr:uncharacterized protein LOC115810733 [Chanos chanos]
MARNEEKHYGKLNRLWLQRERQEGRIRAVHTSRPNLATLNSVASVKKWIPSIKSEIEYYLQQSQLTHYPERKIAEFQQRIKELEREYKCYLRKLRSLDPTCKHPPRGYVRRRAEFDGSCAAKGLCSALSSNQMDQRPTILHDNEETGDEQTVSADKQSALFSPAPSTALDTETPEQDRPLAFQHSKLAVARPRVVRMDQNTDSLAQVLFTGLPNLHTSALACATAVHGRGEERKAVPTSPAPAQHRSGHVLGLGCYSSSSDEDT